MGILGNIYAVHFVKTQINQLKIRAEHCLFVSY